MLERAQHEVSLLASLEKTREARAVHLWKSGTSSQQLSNGHEMN